jgi:hypothetical protein
MKLILPHTKHNSSGRLMRLLIMFMLFQFMVRKTDAGRTIDTHTVILIDANLFKDVLFSMLLI